MPVHEQFAEDLALHALGSLQGSDLNTLQDHLQECASCRRELDELRGDMALMALSSGGPRPPARSRQRLMDAIAREPKISAVPSRRAWWRTATLVASSVAALIILLLVRQDTNLIQQASSLQQQVANLQSDSLAEQAELTRAREVVATLTSPDAQRVTLVAANTPPQPQGKAIYVRDRASLIFLASNFRALPAGRAYELWLVPISGNPIAAGVFKPDARGSATVVNPPLPPGVEAKAFAITIEPEAGSVVATTAPIMLGAGI